MSNKLHVYVAIDRAIILQKISVCELAIVYISQWLGRLEKLDKCL